MRIAAIDYGQALFAAPLIEPLRRAGAGLRLVFRSLTRCGARDPARAEARHWNMSIGPV